MNTMKYCRKISETERKAMTWATKQTLLKTALNNKNLDSLIDFYK